MTTEPLTWTLPEVPPTGSVAGTAVGDPAGTRTARGPQAPPLAPSGLTGQSEPPTGHGQLPTGQMGPVGPPPWPGRAARRLATAAGAAALVLAAGGVGGVVGARLDNNARTATTPTMVVAPAAGAPITQTVISSGGLDVGAVLGAVEAAVVDIQARSSRSSGEGTGIVYSSDGLVLTNAHVVSGATTVTVTTSTDTKGRAATVIGMDEDHDIAVLKITDPAGLTVAQLGDSADVKVGADVVAIGNALGLRGDPTVTRGIVSGVGRSIGNLTGLLQTDAAINHGNSGGPLVDANGRVIGINTAIAVENGAQNIGFAIPVDLAKSIADRITSGTPATPVGFLGISTSDAQDATTGAIVSQITAGSPAADARLLVGDVVVAIDGARVSGASDLSRLIGQRQPGNTVTLTVLRGGQQRQLTARLTTRPSS